MSAERHSDAMKVPDGAGRPGVLASRRRMLRRSLVTAAPVVTTLASGPVAAGVCLNASGFVSAATFNSRHPGLNNCDGVSPAGWVNQTAWPVDKNTQKFNAIFASGGSYKLAIGSVNNPTFLQALQCQNVLAQDVAAAWLNAMNHTAGYVVTTDQAVAIWRALYSGGTYQPPNVVTPWSAAQTREWLEFSWKL